MVSACGRGGIESGDTGAGKGRRSLHAAGHFDTV
jgi:hypothetical protein